MHAYIYIYVHTHVWASKDNAHLIGLWGPSDHHVQVGHGFLPCIQLRRIMSDIGAFSFVLIKSYDKFW